MEQLPMFARCRIHNKPNMPIKFLFHTCVRGIHGRFVSCEWSPLTFSNLFKNLSLEYRDTLTSNLVTIECTFCPRNCLINWYLIAFHFLQFHKIKKKAFNVGFLLLSTC